MAGQVQVSDVLKREEYEKRVVKALASFENPTPGQRRQVEKDIAVDMGLATRDEIKTKDVVQTIKQETKKANTVKSVQDIMTLKKITNENYQKLSVEDKQKIQGELSKVATYNMGDEVNAVISVAKKFGIDLLK